MGTPTFAVPSLNALHRNGHQLLAVFCQPDRAKGRSKALQMCPVKSAALKLGITVLQPTSLKDPHVLAKIESLNPDVIVVAAYGKILGKRLLRLPKYGCINVHASLLPRWRGASPIHQAILAGDSETGISIMRMTPGLDAGPVYQQEKVSIAQGIDRTSLEEQLARCGADLLCDVLQSIEHRQPRPQDESHVTFAPIITKEMGFVDFEQSAFDIERMTRAFHDWPGVWCRYGSNRLRLIDILPMSHSHQFPPGTIIFCDRKTCRVAAGKHTVFDILKIQPAGKSAMPISAFLNGHPLSSNDRLELMSEPDD